MTAILNQTTGIHAASQPNKFDINLVCDQISRDGFSHIAGLLPKSLLISLYKEIEKKDKKDELQLAGTGRGKNYTIYEAIRSDKIKWIDGETLA